ncbi:Barstar (barnase inhibitor) [Microlunatus sagamiharensis]|uniref:Barstar (Barnase inhibitor) n=1 Tax=Microlunatus sagamiharensis TaxID=546874 RepID=A0A1H2MR33_9ACTN|nr:barstar family protein [Microlunatus sagamiharensis]SDU95371.1 Barstar (barnase inhibitor) [Microlunatus sagamiharensis]
MSGLRGGVRRVLGPAEEVGALLAEDGWDVGLVPRAGDDAALWDGLTSALALPGWFGRNLDALEEALHDLERPTALVVAAWWAYATARPDRWASLLELLTGRSAEEPPLLVVLAD